MCNYKIFTALISESFDQTFLKVCAVELAEPVFILRLYGQKKKRLRDLDNLKDRSLNSINSSAAFLFDTKGTKRKAIKREMPRKISPSADGDKGSAPWPRELLKKLDQNFSYWVCANMENTADSSVLITKKK